ncbi:MAG: phosphotransferase, partial [Anaerolineae bacterium]|nr:phosphotransferase [Anaerolineae bacterium]
VAQGWLLMRDGGVTLRSLVQSVDDFDHWHAILPAYAALQQAMIARAEELLALGVLDRRLSTLPEQVARLLDDTGALLIDQPDGLTAAEYQQLRDLLPEYAALCARLARYGIPETLHHEDFHDANIFVQEGDGAARYTFADWGESGVAPPFFTLLVMLRSIAYRLKLEFDGPEMQALRDVYLSAWTDYGTLDDLRAAADLAARVAMPARALTWYRVVSALPESERAEDAGAVPGWLQVFLEAQAG